MEKTDIIEQFRAVVIQIATPYSTGTGFYLKKYNMIVTNEHVVRDNKSVVVDGNNFEKQLVDVKYVDPKFDLAFLDAPVTKAMPEIIFSDLKNHKEGDVVLAVGHPFGLKYTATEGIISNMQHEQNDITYIQHDAALNPGNSGGPLLNSVAEVIGVNTFIIKDGHSIGFSLPITYLIETLEEFVKDKEAAVRCNSCSNIVFESKAEDGYCSFCGTKITMISDIDPYEPFGVNKTIEDILEQLDYDIDLSRRGPNNWQIQQGSAQINISYHSKTGLVVGDAYLCRLPKQDIKPLYKFLLEENYKISGLTFSVKNQDIIMSLLIYDQYLNVKTGVKLFENLFKAADHYDNILVEDFGAIWKQES